MNPEIVNGLAVLGGLFIVLIILLVLVCIWSAYDDFQMFQRRTKVDVECLRRSEVRQGGQVSALETQVAILQRQVKALTPTDYRQGS